MSTVWYSGAVSSGLDSATVKTTQTDQAWQWNKQNHMADSGVNGKDKAINIPLCEKWAGEETWLEYGSFLP